MVLRKKCNHDYISLASHNGYRYICKHCLKTRKISWSWKAEEFELKQMLIGHPVQTSFNYKVNFNRLNELPKWEKNDD